MGIGKLLITAGVVLFLAGLLIQFLHLFPNFTPGRLPGDFRFRRGGFSFYFPATTCILLSVLLTLVMYIFRK
jgi:hypothetical protein